MLAFLGCREGRHGRSNQGASQQSICQAHFLCDPHGIHLLSLQELDSAANCRDDEDDDDGGGGICKSKLLKPPCSHESCLRTDSDSGGLGWALRFSISDKLLGVPVLLDHQAH